MKLLEIFSQMPMGVVLRREQTGLPGDVYISVGYQYGTKLQHGPRIKFYMESYPSGKNKSYTIHKKPEQINPELPPKIKGKEDKLVKDFIDKNYDVLMQHHNGELSNEEVVTLIQRV